MVVLHPGLPESVCVWLWQRNYVRLLYHMACNLPVQLVDLGPIDNDMPLHFLIQFFQFGVFYEASICIAVAPVGLPGRNIGPSTDSSMPMNHLFMGSTPRD